MVLTSRTSENSARIDSTFHLPSNGAIPSLKNLAEQVQQLSNTCLRPGDNSRVSAQSETTHANAVPSKPATTLNNMAASLSSVSAANLDNLSNTTPTPKKNRLKLLGAGLKPLVLACAPKTKTEELKQILKNFHHKAETIFHHNLSSARFHDIPTAAHTLVTAPDGVPLAANRVQVAGTNIAIASQYPKKEYLESYFCALVENRTPVLVVLASEAEIKDSKLPPYFKENGTYGKIRVVSHNCGDHLLNGIGMQHYQLDIAGGDKAISIPVIHITEWPDRSAITADQSQDLGEHVSKIHAEQLSHLQKQGSRAFSDPNKLLPVIHCRGGVGRTGQLIAAMELLKKQSLLSLQSIVEDMRHSRNHLMVQTDEQLDALTHLATQLKKPLLKLSHLSPLLRAS